MSTPKGQSFGASTRKIALIFLAIGVAILTLSLGAIPLFRAQPVSAARFWTGVAILAGSIIGVLFIYRAFALFTLKYTLTRNGLDIRWGLLSHRIPIDLIKTMTIVTADARPSRRWLGIIPVPSEWLGQQNNAYFYNPSMEGGTVRVDIEGAEIFVSPTSAESFIAAWEVRAPLGTTQHWQNEIIRRGWLRYPIWVDPLARRLILGAIALTLVLAGGVFSQYPDLPEKINLSMNALGQSSVLVAREQLLWLPAGGAIILLFNLLLGAAYYGKNKFAAYMLWFLAAMVQIGLWVGVRLVIG